MIICWWQKQTFKQWDNLPPFMNDKNAWVISPALISSDGVNSLWLCKDNFVSLNKMLNFSKLQQQWYISTQSES